MGMTIEQAISEVVNDYKAKKLVDNDYSDDFKEAIITLVKIAMKYQKIKEQVDIAIDKENFAISGARLIQIREIIDRNDRN